MSYLETDSAKSLHDKVIVEIFSGCDSDGVRDIPAFKFEAPSRH